MRYFLANLFLAFLWTLASGSFTLPSFLAGFLLGFVILAVGRPVVGKTSYFRRTLALVRFAGYFAVQVVKANVILAHDVLTPRHRLKAGVIAVRLEARTPLEITALANLLTLTPGSLSLDISDDRRTLYLHAMFRGTPDEFRREISEGLERRLLELLR